MKYLIPLLFLVGCSTINFRQLEPGDKVVSVFYPNSVMTVETAYEDDIIEPHKAHKSDFVCGQVIYSSNKVRYDCWPIKGAEATK